ncbi:MAG TPA: hypothetical protein VJR89_30475, partial [Polyangiales bacterium]|nr:hypothetical protein [Polyangiales bacterium]
MDPEMRIALTLAVLHTLTCLVAWQFYSWLWRRNVAPDRQVGPGRVANPELTRSAFIEAGMQQLLFALFCYFVVYPIWTWRSGGMTQPWHGFWLMLGHLIVFALVQDTIFYWSHRVLHTRWLFKHIHSKHHRFRF